MGSMAKSAISLTPWDPDSPEHVERLYQQRIACGWSEQAVESWREKQRSGKMAIQWVLDDSDISTETKLVEHIKAFPSETKPLSDTASSLGGKPRTPSSASFIPVGHISLDADGDDPSRAESYGISTFYISRVLQGGGLGRAAMDAIEIVATSEPLNAKSLWLYTMANEQEEQTRQWELRANQPKISRQDWYQRRGYEVYRIIARGLSHVDEQGNTLWFNLIYMRKNIT